MSKIQPKDGEWALRHLNERSSAIWLLEKLTNIRTKNATKVKMPKLF